MAITDWTVMNSQNPRWNEFLNRLEGPEGCNFREKGGEYAWDCDNTYTKAREILKKFGLTDEEIHASLDGFEALGGHCDCEILFNCD